VKNILYQIHSFSSSFHEQPWCSAGNLDLPEIPNYWLRWSAIRASPIYLSHTRLYRDVSRPFLRGRSFRPSIFFLASTIHPWALIEARAMDIGYREKKNLVERSLHTLHDRYAAAVSWRGAIGRSAVQKARTREKRCEWTDRQMDRQADRKWNVLGGELNDVFEFGRYHPFGHPADERDERVALLPSASLRKDPRVNKPRVDKLQRAYAPRSALLRTWFNVMDADLNLRRCLSKLSSNTAKMARGTIVTSG